MTTKGTHLKSVSLLLVLDRTLHLRHCSKKNTEWCMDGCACTINIAGYVTFAQFKQLASSEWTPEITLRWLIYQYGLSTSNYLCTSKIHPQHAILTRQPRMYFGSSKMREAANAAFQLERNLDAGELLHKDPPDVLIGSIRLMATGLTLPQASVVMIPAAIRKSSSGPNASLKRTYSCECPTGRTASANQSNWSATQLVFESHAKYIVSPLVLAHR